MKNFEELLQKELDKLPYTKHLDDGQYNDGQVAGFEIGARWALSLFEVTSSTFDNSERRRYYGLRIGDIVLPKGISGEEWRKGIAEVINYGSDNNRVEIKSKDGTITDWIAEWCDIITRVEDRI